MNGFSHHFAFIILALTLTACGAKNSKSLPGLDNASVQTLPTPDDLITVPDSTITISDSGSQIEVSKDASAVVKDPASEDDILSTVTLPVQTGPVLIEVISPETTSQTIVNVDPAYPDQEPAVKVEIIVPENKPVVETVSPPQAVVLPTETIMDVVENNLKEKVKDFMDEKNKNKDMDVLLKDEILSDLKTNLQKRIMVLDHRIKMHEKEHQQVNKEQLLKWMMELQELQVLLDEIK